MSEKVKVSVTSTVPQGELGLILVDEMNRNYSIWFAKPGVTKSLIEEDLMRSLDEIPGMARMINKGYFKINKEDIQEILEDKGLNVEKEVLDDIAIKLLLAEKNMKNFVSKLENTHETSIQRMAHLMVETGNVDLNKAKEVEKYINFKISDMVEQKNIEQEAKASN